MHLLYIARRVRGESRSATRTSFSLRGGAGRWDRGTRGEGGLRGRGAFWNEARKVRPYNPSLAFHVSSEAMTSRALYADGDGRTWIGDVDIPIQSTSPTAGWLLIWCPSAWEILRWGLSGRIVCHRIWIGSSTEWSLYQVSRGVSPTCTHQQQASRWTDTESNGVR